MWGRCVIRATQRSSTSTGPAPSVASWSASTATSPRPTRRRVSCARQIPTTRKITTCSDLKVWIVDLLYLTPEKQVSYKYLTTKLVTKSISKEPDKEHEVPCPRTQVVCRGFEPWTCCMRVHGLNHSTVIAVGVICLNDAWRRISMKMNSDIAHSLIPVTINLKNQPWVHCHGCVCY